VTENNSAMIAEWRRSLSELRAAYLAFVAVAGEKMVRGSKPPGEDVRCALTHLARAERALLEATGDLRISYAPWRTRLRLPVIEQSAPTDWSTIDGGGADGHEATMRSLRFFHSADRLALDAHLAKLRTRAMSAARQSRRKAIIDWHTPTFPSPSSQEAPAMPKGKPTPLD
jgi:hypothetical protein